MFKKFKELFHAFNASREIKRSIPELRRDSLGLNAEQLIDLIYGSKWERFFWIKQIKSEIAELTSLIEKRNPKVVLEIGTNMGGSLFLFTKVSRPDAIIISVDLEGGPGGGGYPKFREQFYRSFADQDRSMYLVRGDSHDHTVFEKVTKLLSNQQVDFLFLDGDHSYEGIKQDFEMYAPLVGPRGMIAFHDIKPSSPENWRQVNPFWDELKMSNKHLEILGSEATWGGIGVLYK